VQHPTAVQRVRGHEQVEEHEADVDDDGGAAQVRAEVARVLEPAGSCMPRHMSALNSRHKGSFLCVC